MFNIVTFNRFGRFDPLLMEMRNGSAAGVDGMSTELLKNAPVELIDEVWRIITEVWMTSKVPRECSKTVQIPIPKVGHPSSTDDYRRLTLCNVIYKIYAKILLLRLKENLGNLPSYQAAFQKNRSAGNLIYAVRRVLEKRWRKGKITYVVALDLKKAFDIVDAKEIMRILAELRAPIHLVNQIIEACVKEETSIQWYGQRTQCETKTNDVKQGCS
jgi:hypothetical protein